MATVAARFAGDHMSSAKTLMVQGTASTVGKSTLVTGLCRIFAQDGWRVAPFKAQNMALNSFVTQGGGEIGRAQAVQAEAAGIEPTVEMNPILLKPEGMSRSQVIVLGRPLGTLMLLEPEDRARVKGLVVNKFRGDLSLWQSGEQLLAERSGVPVLGTIPFFNDIRIAEEDSVALDEGTASVLQRQHDQGKSLLEVVVVRLPYLSNYDGFDALAVEPLVRLRFAASPAEFPAQPDLIILPGTKNTLSDLAWLWRQGLAQHIRQCAQQGCAVLGLCGGYQMLGERLSDYVGADADAGTVEPGLNLLPVETFFEPISEKITQRSEAQVDESALRGLFAHMHRQRFQAYQSHVGRTVTIGRNGQGGTYAFETPPTGKDGWLSAGGWCAGCHLHGLFENDNFRQSIIAALAVRRSAQFVLPEGVSFNRHVAYDKLAGFLRQHIDIHRLKALCRLTD